VRLLLLSSRPGAAAAAPRSRSPGLLKGQATDHAKAVDCRPDALWHTTR
jgi:hypothetical protein